MVSGPLFRCGRIAAPIRMRSRAHRGGIVARVARVKWLTLAMVFVQCIKDMPRVARVASGLRRRAWARAGGRTRVYARVRVYPFPLSPSSAK